MANKKHEVDWGGRGAASVPKLLMGHPDWLMLSGSARNVMDLLLYQFNGSNNGNLAATHSMFECRGGMAEGTLAKALRELQEANLIVKTRTNQKGREGARCALYALTWVRIHDCPGKELELGPTKFASRKIVA